MYLFLKVVYLEGCRLEDGSMRKFMEVWSEDEQIKRRCSWSTDKAGHLFAEIVDFGKFLLHFIC